MPDEAASAPGEGAAGPTRIRILERAVRRLSGVRVGVLNLWARDYEDAAGVARHGPTARLAIGQDGTTHVVGAGSVVRVAGVPWTAVEVVPGTGATGHVVFERG